MISNMFTNSGTYARKNKKKIKNLKTPAMHHQISNSSTSVRGDVIFPLPLPLLLLLSKIKIHDRSSSATISYRTFALQAMIAVSKSDHPSGELLQTMASGSTLITISHRSSAALIQNFRFSMHRYGFMVSVW